MKKLGVITSMENSGIIYLKDLRNLFKYSDIKIYNYSFEKNNFSDKDLIDEINSLDVLLISTNEQYNILENKLESKLKIIIAELTLSKEGFNKLKSLDYKEEIYLVNLSMEMCLETISLIYKLGFEDFSFVPYYPERSSINDSIKIAITTGEENLIPKNVKKMYDLGHRMLDAKTIVKLCRELDMEDLIFSKSLKDYFDNIETNSSELHELLSISNLMKEHFDALLDILEFGVLYVDKNKKIKYSNKLSEKLLDRQRDDLIGKNINLVLNNLNIETSKKDNILFEYENKYLSLTIRDVYDNNKYIGSYIMIEDFLVKEKNQIKLKQQLNKKNYNTKYKLKNLVGESKEIVEIKGIIEKIALSDASVLITGETGTGKEIVAQSIHNLSNRKEEAFVAINCSAFNKSLLESELFGYESGAFTGASKKGKVGIFELASEGTLFLDEIGDIPLETQIRLLRVIQEKEVIRVGGTDIIKVNPRIITATNVDLMSKIEEGAFRRDLFYRLNVLPINLPPLRERNGDINLLFNYFIEKFNYNFTISKDTYDFINEYNWNGNVREVINCVEYFNSLRKEIIKLEDLPYYIKKSYSENVVLELSSEETTVLKIIYEYYLKGKKVGRQKILEIALNDKIHITEYEIKNIMENLKDKDYIDSSRGRAGSSITKKGIEYMSKIYK